MSIAKEKYFLAKKQQKKPICVVNYVDLAKNSTNRIDLFSAKCGIFEKTIDKLRSI